MSEEILEVITDLLNALEAAAVDAKQRIAKLAGVKAWDPAGIKWEPAESSKGPYERSDDVDNPEFKAMVKDLAAHGGRVTRDGLFYWIFKDGAVVGRKKRGKREPEPAAALEKISELFPEDLRSMFSFEETVNGVVIRPRQYLGSESFAKAASIVRDAGGEYVSQGRESHFKVSKKPAK